MPAISGAGLLLLLTLAALAASQLSASCMSSGMPYEVYDNFPDGSAMGLAPVIDGLCSSVTTTRTTGSNFEIVQLFTPPSLPFRYKLLCAQVNYNGELENSNFTQLYDAVMYYQDPSTGLPQTNPVATQRTLMPATQWISMPISFEATQSRVYLGLRVKMSCAQFIYTYYPYLPGRASYMRNVGSSWNVSKADWSSDNRSVLSIRAQGVPVTETPDDWICNESQYSDGKVCNCECGVYDPDCSSEVVGPISPNCSTGYVCSRLGTCINPGWDETKCALHSFGSYDGCNCGCGGTIDPDCRDFTVAGQWYPRAQNCSGMKVAKCSDTGLCVEAWPGSSCPASGYADGEYCDCGCQSGGVLDPDCAIKQIHTASVKHIVTANSSCGWNNFCWADTCIGVPAKWSCDPDDYYSDMCQCGCGVAPTSCLSVKSSSYVNGCSSNHVCAANASCVAAGCGNAVLETLTENCELDGRGCHDCDCKPGWIVTTPLSKSCKENCGDGMAVGAEQCDGGLFCFLNCTCMPGHTAYSPSQPGCTGCGNEVVDAGEECDKGQGCNTVSCKCETGYEPTYPTTVGCKKIIYKCGDGAVQANEECDSGTFCKNCSCTSGYLPYSPPDPSCRGCGNGILDDGEQCDMGQGCNRTCLCEQGYQHTTPLSTVCVAIVKTCGDLVVISGEECDGGQFCNTNCTCEHGYAPYSPSETYCFGCGNGVLDAGEECDKGPGCNTTCHCSGGYYATVPPSLGCRILVAVKSDDGGGDDLSITVGVPVGVTSIVALLGACAVIVVYLSRKRRKAPNMMLESPIHTDGTTTVVATQVQSQNKYAMNAQGIISTAPDGTPIVVPVSSSGSSGSMPTPKSANDTLAAPGGFIVQGFDPQMMLATQFVNTMLDSTAAAPEMTTAQSGTAGFQSGISTTSSGAPTNLPPTL